jgi:hypothetical protein
MLQNVRGPESGRGAPSSLGVTVTSVVLFGDSVPYILKLLASVAQASSHVLQEGGGERSQVDDAACPRVGKLVRK